MKKALIVTTVASHAQQFCMNDLRCLQNLGYEVRIVSNFINGTAFSPEKCREFQEQLRKEGILFYQVDFSRSPFDLFAHIRAFRQMKRILIDGYSLIHCHTPIGGALCRMAAKHSPSKILYTAHGFHFFKGAPLQNWMLYYPVEKLCARWTNVLITINKEDYEFAKRKMRAGHIEYIPGVGIDLNRFSPDHASPKRVEELRCNLGLAPSDKMLFSVGELSTRKNFESVLRALAVLKDPSLHYVICGCGSKEASLKRLAKKLGLSDKLHLLGFKDRVEDFYPCADLFILPSLQEGLPVAMMEAIASGVPTIGSDIRGNRELLEQDALFPPSDSLILAERIRQFLSSDQSERTSRSRLHLQAFSTELVSARMREIYESVERM